MKNLINLFALGCLCFVSVGATAHAWELAAYYEGEVTFLWKVERPAGTTEDQVVVYTCPKDTPINSSSDCSNPQVVVAVSKFKDHVSKFLKDWARLHPKTALDPLTVDDMSAIASLSDEGQAQSKLIQLTSDKAANNKMLQLFPNSTAYLEKDKNITQQIATLQKETGAQLPLDSLINDLSASLLEKIQDSKLAAYTRSQNEGKFYYEVMQSLLGPPFPQGDWSITSNGRVIHVGLKNHYCWYDPSAWAVLGSGTYKSMSTLPDGLIYDGRCGASGASNEGDWAVQTDGKVIHTNTEGHYCWFRNPHAWNKYGSGNAVSIDVIPAGLVYDGYCGK